MKLTTQLRLFIIAVLLLLGISEAQAQWAMLGDTTVSVITTNHLTMAINSNNVPYVAYAAGTGNATVMEYSGGNWDTVGSAGFSAGAIYYTDIAFDSHDTAYIAYRDGGNSNKATVMKFNGSSWVTVGSAGFSAGTASYTSIAIDDNDVVYVAYQDGGNSSKATVMKFNGSSWVTVGSAGFSAGNANYTSIAIDNNDTAYVAYQDGGNSNKATVMKYNGSSWVVAGSAGFSVGAAYYTDIAFDNNDTAYIAYRDAGNSNKATVMKYNGSSWGTVGSAGFSAGLASYTSLAIDKYNTAYVGYTDGNSSSKASVMKYNGSSWVTVGSAGFSSGNVDNVKLAFDNDNFPYMAYCDGGNSYKAVMMKYEVTNTWNGSTWSNGTPDSTQKAVISSNTTPTTFSCKNLSIESGYALNTGTSEVVTIYGDLTNNGNGVTGTGTLTFTKDGTANISGDTVDIAGAVVVESGCTLTTNNLLRLTSDASNTGRIGNSSGTISGNVMVQRYMPGKRCFRFYGHPFSSSIALSQLTDEVDITGSGGSANGFTMTQTNSPSAFWFDVTAADTSTTGTNPGWTAFTSATSADWDQYELLRLFIRGAKGEGLTGGSYTPSAATFEAAGAVNQGTQVITLTKGSNTTFAGCGNPFPSPVQMNTVTVGSNVGANYYAWDATSGAAGAYVTNAWTLDWKLPAYAAFFTTVSANSNNTLTFEEQDKESTGTGLFKTTATKSWVELYIYDSTTKWDRLLIHLDDNAMEVEDKMDGKKLYNPGLDFFTLSKDGVRLAVDVRPYEDSSSIPLGLTAYNRYNKYVIKTGMFDIPAGTKLYLHDKYLNKKEELKAGFEYWFDVTSNSLSQGNDRFEINMVGKPAGIIEASNRTPQMQLIPNPAQDEVKVSFKALEGKGVVRMVSITGETVYYKEVQAGIGSVIIQLQDIPAGMYIVELNGDNASFTQKLVKQ